MSKSLQNSCGLCPAISRLRLDVTVDIIIIIIIIIISAIDSTLELVIYAP
jgi:hypothetical protein